MSQAANRTVDLHGFVLREFLEFVRKEDPTWLEGSQVRRSDDGHQRSGLVDGLVWVEVLLSEKSAEALARVLARADAFDDDETDAVLTLRKALRLGDVGGA